MVKKCPNCLHSASSKHPDWRILQDYDCYSNDISWKDGVYSIEDCISYCINVTDCDAVTLLRSGMYANRCHFKSKKCINASKRMNMTSAYTTTQLVVKSGKVTTTKSTWLSTKHSENAFLFLRAASNVFTILSRKPEVYNN